LGRPYGKLEIVVHVLIFPWPPLTRTFSCFQFLLFFTTKKHSQLNTVQVPPLCPQSSRVYRNCRIMKVDYPTPFLSWAAAKGISTPLQLVCDDKTNYRSMRIPSTSTVQTLTSQSTSTEGLVNVVEVPLDACIVGKDLPTLVEKLKHEKSLGDSSFYAPWLDTFPTLDDFLGMPRFWDKDRLDFVSKFDGGQLKGRVGIDQARINQCDDPWALAIVDSRTNYLPDETYSLTPMLDMFNHDPTYKTSARVEESKRLMLDVSSESIIASTATTGVDWKDQVFGFLKGGNDNQMKAGDEIFVSYGEFDNVELLSNYGFCTVENPSNIEQVKVRSLAMGTKPTILIVDSQGSIDNIFNMMSLDSLRVSLASTSELEKYEGEGSGKISEANEIEMYALIAGELEEAVYDATAGAKEAKLRDDLLLSTYLQGRQRTLECGLNALKTKYPEIF
jgi:hypothetical protein